MRRSAISLLAAILSSSVLAATPPADPEIPAGAYEPVTAVAKNTTGIAESRGGAVRVRWNQQLLADLGIGEVRPIGKFTLQSELGFDFPMTQESTFRIDGTRAMIHSIVAADGAWIGGFRASGKNGTLSFVNPRMRLQRSPLRIDLVDADGNSDAYLDQVMYEFVDEGRSFRIRSADMRLTPAGAARIGHPDQAGLAIAEIRSLSPMAVLANPQSPDSCADPN